MPRRRSWTSTSRELERDARRRTLQHEAQREREAQATELQRAADEIEAHDKAVHALVSLHTRCSEPWDWHRFAADVEPAKPQPDWSREKQAQKVLADYKAPRAIRLLGGDEYERETLRAAVILAHRDDEQEYQAELEEYGHRYAAWQRRTALAKRVCAASPAAYVEAVAYSNAFAGMQQIGSCLTIHVADKHLVEATLHANGDSIVPSVTKTRLTSGKLSVKPMPKGAFYHLYQAHVCSCVLRVAWELLALLPIGVAVVTAVGRPAEAVQPGVERPLVSVAVTRGDFTSVYRAVPDATECITALLHRMKFKKLQGFAAVEKLVPADVNV